MAKESKSSGTKYSFSLLGFLFSIAIAKIGYVIHGSLFWAIVDFIFSPIALLKWIITEEITLSVIKQAFHWFFK